MKILQIIIILLFSNTVLAEQVLFDTFKSNYIKQMTPYMHQQLKEAEPDMEENELNNEVKLIVERMAECQLQSIDHYPEKYWNAYVLPISNGEEMSVVYASLEELMMNDVKKGKISKSEVIEMVGQAQSKTRACFE